MKALSGSATMSQLAANPRRNKGSATHSAMAYLGTPRGRAGRAATVSGRADLVHAAASADVEHAHPAELGELGLVGVEHVQPRSRDPCNVNSRMPRCAWHCMIVSTVRSVGASVVP